MRRILVDSARARRAGKRGGEWERVTLSTNLNAGKDTATDVIAVDEALTKLAQLDPRQARVVELRFFAGLTVEEVAAALSLSRSSIEADWRVARAWLASRLGHAV